MRVFDSLRKEKVDFVPLEENKIKMYTCGPTVYNHIHIGNAKTFIAFDFVKRCFLFLGYDVEHVQNITDVGHLTDDSDEGDDKIATEAKKQKVDPFKIARQYEESYLNDMKDLGAMEWTHKPRATEYIDQMIAFCQTLIEKEYAYEANGSIYFRVNKFADYGKLSGNILENLKQDASERTTKTYEKEDARDFALWKRADANHLMQWDSPWGKGFPGWHIECSVMARELLGDTIDIKGGGQDLKFPHHEDEIAQSECCTGKTYANYYMHSAFMLVNGEKMSKSKGNFFTARELIDKYGAGAIRYALIMNNYRQPVNFNTDLIENAKKNVESYLDTFTKLKKAETHAISEDELGTVYDKLDSIRNKFNSAIRDDFNNSIMISEMFELLSLINKQIESKKVSESLKSRLVKEFEEYDTIFNLLIYNKELPEEIKYLVELREKAREDKDWAKSDELRDQLKEKGYNVKDSKQGSIVTPIN